MKKTINKKTKVSKTTKKTVKAAVKQQHNSFVDAIIKYWNGYFDFKGSSSRKEYWYAVLFVFLLDMVFWVIGVKFLSALLTAVLFLPSRAVAFRRYRDAGFSGLLNLIPYLILFGWSGIRSAKWLFFLNLEFIPTDLKIYLLISCVWGIFNLYVLLQPTKNNICNK